METEVNLELKEPWSGFVKNNDFLSGRDSRTLSKLFEGIANSSVEYEIMLNKVKEISTAEQKKFIVGLRY